MSSKSKLSVETLKAVLETQTGGHMVSDAQLKIIVEEVNSVISPTLVVQFDC